MQQLTKKALQIFVKNLWWRALKDEEREKTSRNHVIIAKKEHYYDEKRICNTQSKNWAIWRKSEKTGYARVWTRDLWDVNWQVFYSQCQDDKQGVLHIIYEMLSNEKTGNAPNYMIKSAGVHVTWTLHPDLIRVLSQRMKFPERVGTSYQASKVRSN